MNDPGPGPLPPDALGEPTPTLSRDQPSAAAAEPLRPGDRVDRYSVLGELGAGGMGVVYAAYDPRLDRKIALKLLRRRSSAGEPERQARLLREAKALARLNHPHVLTIYDAGTAHGQIFLAIEFVEGVDLGHWLRQETRRREEILRLFTEAGRGLAAAHHEGLVHRDFKPSNVMVSAADGRALVLDFGLARSAGGDAADENAPAAGRVGKGDAALTRDGALLGTPLFMAPEQWGGEPGPAADQFSFCASLYLALYGELPFARSPAGMPVDWRVRPAPEGSTVPARLRRALVRGLSFEPEQRFPSMDELLRQLGHDPGRRRRRLAAMLAGLIVAAGAGFYMARGPSPCEGAGDRIGAVWNGERRSALEETLNASGRDYAPAIFATVAELLDGYAAAWSAGYEDACLATHRRGDQSPRLMDLRIACLENRRRELSTLLELLIGEADAIERAIPAVSGLSAIEECADTAALTAPNELPEDAAQRAEIAATRDRLAENRARLAAGHYRQAAAQAAELEERSREIGYLPLTAEALIRLGKAQEALAQGSEAAASFERAVWVAQAGNHDLAGAEALTQMVRVAGHLLKQPERGAFFGELARGALGRLDRAESLEARLLDHLGVLELEDGRPERAAELHREALDLRLALLGADHPAIARSLIRLSSVWHDLGRFEKAEQALREALDIQRRRLGPGHPEIAAGLDRLGNMAYQLGRLDEAENHYAEALEILVAHFDAESTRVAATQLHLATVRSAAGRHEEALELYQGAREIFVAALGAEHPNVAAAWSNIGTTLLAMGRHREAGEAYAEALRIQRSTLGDGHPALATTYFNLGEVASELADFAAAQSRHRRALELWRGALGEEHFLVGHGLTGLGRAQLGAGRRRAAARSLEQALELWRDHVQDPAVPAWTRWLLAQAVADEHPARARDLARQALEGYRGAASAEPRIMAEIEAWLADGS